MCSGGDGGEEGIQKGNVEINHPVCNFGGKAGFRVPQKYFRAGCP